MRKMLIFTTVGRSNQRAARSLINPEDPEEDEPIHQHMDLLQLRLLCLQTSSSNRSSALSSPAVLQRFFPGRATRSS